MQVAGLFAGIGGLELGLSHSGHNSVLLSEIWGPAQAVLAEKFPDAEQLGDVLTIKSLPNDIELLTAGFPCQDLSQAGRTAGISGPRSGLVAQIIKLLENRRLPWVLLENVSFMLQLDGGKAMTFLVEEFERLGYRWAYRVVNSEAYLPQRRERVIFVATNTEVDPAAVVHVDDAASNRREGNLESLAHGFYWTEGIRGLGWAIDSIPTLKNGSTIGIPSPPAILLPTGRVITPDIRDAERLQGFPKDWTAAARNVSRESSRWSLVGNAVSVPIARWVGERLSRPGQYDTIRDAPLDTELRWPKAARYDGEKRFAVRIGPYPVWEDRRPLDEFLLYPGKNLSARAAKGFLARTERSRLRFVEGFREAVRLHLHLLEGAESYVTVAAE